MRRGGLQQLCALTLCCASVSGRTAEKPKLPLPDVSQFVGSVGCKSSYCHGGAGENKGQYLTWVQQDYHTRAYAILVSARSTRMVEALANSPATSPSEMLGLKSGPTASPTCTVCHSPMRAMQSPASSGLTNVAF